MTRQVELDYFDLFRGTSANPAWNHLCTNANILYVTCLPSLNNDTISVTYDSVAMTSIITQVTSNPRIEVFRLVNPHPGNHQVYVTQASSVCGVWGSFSLKKVDITTLEISITQGSGSSGSHSSNVLSVPVGGTAFDLYSIRNTPGLTAPSTYGQTALNHVRQSCAYSHGHSNSYEDGSGTIGMASAWANSTVFGWAKWALGPSELAGSQLLIAQMSKVDELYKDLKRGWLGRDEVLRRHRELMNPFEKGLVTV